MSKEKEYKSYIGTKNDTRVKNFRYKRVGMKMNVYHRQKVKIAVLDLYVDTDKLNEILSENKTNKVSPFDYFYLIINNKKYFLNELNNVEFYKN